MQLQPHFIRLLQAAYAFVVIEYDFMRAQGVEIGNCPFDLRLLPLLEIAVYKTVPQGVSLAADDICSGK